MISWNLVLKIKVPVTIVVCTKVHQYNAAVTRLKTKLSIHMLFEPFGYPTRRRYLLPKGEIVISICSCFQSHCVYFVQLVSLRQLWDDEVCFTEYLSNRLRRGKIVE